jgi:hypothetical protein
VALTVDRGAVLAGAGVGVAVGAGAIVVGQAIGSAAVSMLLFVVLLGGLCAGGRLAGLRQPASPLTHGALAALAAYLTLLVIVSIVQLALGKELADPVYIISNGFWAVTAGIVGGYLAIRKLARPT